MDWERRPKCHLHHPFQTSRYRQRLVTPSLSLQEAPSSISQTTQVIVPAQSRERCHHLLQHRRVLLRSKLKTIPNGIGRTGNRDKKTIGIGRTGKIDVRVDGIDGGNEIVDGHGRKAENQRPGQSPLSLTVWKKTSKASPILESLGMQKPGWRKTRGFSINGSGPKANPS